ncbi:nucleoside-diphosphate sugar epimerase/dehydratase [Bdellovibrio sp. ArHS]|uniref:polysaccharide biosynthesis protein n=1 Tax=Bdellovibrio sp. ArHS TaxID=1569284 RepID=UPI0025C1795E|nr:nucleoside-diphosphate sugar epimerase/dehydratase [Bdellovibrio sp. ArHS]
MMFTDVILLPFVLWLAIALRFGTVSPRIGEYLWLFLVLPIIAIPIFTRLGLYRSIVRYTSAKFFWTVFYGVSVLSILLLALVALVRLDQVPRSSLVIFWILAIGCIAVTRALARVVILSAEQVGVARKKVAIYGAGKAGTQIAFALVNSKEFNPVAFFDDDPDLQGHYLAGLKVFGPDEFEAVLVKKNIDEIVLAIPSAARSRRREIIEGLRPYGAVLKTVPGVAELVNGSVTVSDLREVGIEDLLGRDAVPPDESLLRKCLFEKTVLITGAGGSIGSELCRQIAKHAPSLLILLDNSEFALYSIEREMRIHFPQLRVKPVLADVCDEKALRRVFLEAQIDTVYHAAAYKHVPLVEENPGVGIVNNAIGTLRVSSLSQEFGVSHFVLISTDKAVRPTNVMGASKRLSELILQAYAETSTRTIFSMVRFGNVLGSSGSVVPLFKEQIRKGGPVTVTHPDVIRYFMTIPEAAQLVIQAGAMAQGGEVFVLDMGEPVRIVELARRMVELSGLTVKDSSCPKGDVEIVYSGLRPGEKLYEELLIGADAEKTSHPRILRAKEYSLPKETILEALGRLEIVCAQGDAGLIKDSLSRVVHEYVPHQMKNP